MPASIEFLNTNKGIMARHFHPVYVPKNRDAFGKVREPRPYWVGWLRRDESNWRQYHLMAYGAACEVCGARYLDNKELEGLYQETLRDGKLDELETIEI